MKKNKTVNVLFLAQAAMIAAIYVVLTLVFAPFSYGDRGLCRYDAGQGVRTAQFYVFRIPADRNAGIVMTMI